MELTKNKNLELARDKFGINLSDSSDDDMFNFLDNMDTIKEKNRKKADDIKKKSPTVKPMFNPNTGEMVQKAVDPKLEKNLREYFLYPMKKAPLHTRKGRKSPDIPREDPKKLREREIKYMKKIRRGKRGEVDIAWLKAAEKGRRYVRMKDKETLMKELKAAQDDEQAEKSRYRKQLEKDRQVYLNRNPNPNLKDLQVSLMEQGLLGGRRKTRKKSKRFRNNNLRKNKISRKYIMLKQCGGGKAKMGAKSKPYSSKRKAMKSRRRVCYYRKKGRTLKLKKKKKSRGRKKSRRRRRR